MKNPGIQIKVPGKGLCYYGAEIKYKQVGGIINKQT
jgi:hypothetical protein